MMKEDGWELGYHMHWGVEYWSFRKNGFEIPFDDIHRHDRKMTEIKDEKWNKHFERWKSEDEWKRNNR